jgi:Carboxypeptidase regulatory-like domain
MKANPRTHFGLTRGLKLALLICSFALFASGTVAESGLGTLAGTVVGPNGRPIAGARVTSQEAGGSHPSATTTNSQGRFFFPQLAHGYYDLRAYSNGVWSGWKHNIEVKTGKQTDVTLRVPEGKQTS